MITIGPMFASLYLSFTNYSLIQAPELVGLDNYIRMLGDARLHNSICRSRSSTCSSPFRCN